MRHEIIELYETDIDNDKPSIGYSKEQQIGPKKEKQPTRIKRVSSNPKFRCSDGTLVSQAHINYQLSKIPTKPGMDRSHTISQARCKELHKTELIWHIDNIEYETRERHNEWERYKSGYFEDHPNVVKRMLFVKEHDPEGFEKRKAYLSNSKVLKAIH